MKGLTRSSARCRPNSRAMGGKSDRRIIRSHSKAKWISRRGSRSSEPGTLDSGPGRELQRYTGDWVSFVGLVASETVLVIGLQLNVRL